jgi:large subunit ribosomal protein L4
VDKFELEDHRTKPFAEALSQLGLSRKVLLVDDSGNAHLVLASRNLPEVTLITNLGVTPYQVLDAHHVVFTRAAIQGLDEALAK